MRLGPLISAGIMLGAGLGGFLDGIVLHQILQWHNMMSARITPDTLERAKVNMVWDGFFHAGVWGLTLLGVVALWGATGRAEVARSGRALFGAMLMGWGLFNLIEGVIDHHVLRLHHVNELARNRDVFDYGFLGLGVALYVLGSAIVRAARRRIDRTFSVAAPKGKGYIA